MKAAAYLTVFDMVSYLTGFDFVDSDTLHLVASVDSMNETIGNLRIPPLIPFSAFPPVCYYLHFYHDPLYSELNYDLVGPLDDHYRLGDENGMNHSDGLAHLFENLVLVLSHDDTLHD